MILNKKKVGNKKLLTFSGKMELENINIIYEFSHSNLYEKSKNIYILFFYILLLYGRFVLVLYFFFPKSIGKGVISNAYLLPLLLPSFTLFSFKTLVVTVNDCFSLFQILQFLLSIVDWFKVHPLSRLDSCPSHCYRIRILNLKWSDILRRP